MQLQGIALPGPGPAGGALTQEGPPPGWVDTVVRTVLAVMAAQQPAAASPERPDLPELLTPGQSAKLLGVDRNTIDRMIRDGALPYITLREGSRQRLVRIPKGFALRMLAQLNAGMSIPDVKDYSRQWQASAAIPTAPDDEATAVAS